MDSGVEDGLERLNERRFTCRLMCFFFQAEDGIRDLTVTGVQTCALPISKVAVGDARGVETRHLLPDALEQLVVDAVDKHVVERVAAHALLDEKDLAASPQIGRASCRERV